MKLITILVAVGATYLGTRLLKSAGPARVTATASASAGQTTAAPSGNPGDTPGASPDGSASAKKEISFPTSESMRGKELPASSTYTTGPSTAAAAPDAASPRGAPSDTNPMARSGEATDQP